MIAFYKYKYIAFIIVLAECPLNNCRDTYYNIKNIKEVTRQKQEQKPNIFSVLEEIIDNKVEKPLTNPKYKDILEQADLGIKTMKVLKQRTNTEPPPHFFRSGDKRFYKNTAESSSSNSAESNKLSYKSQERSTETKKDIDMALVVNALLSEEKRRRKSKVDELKLLMRTPKVDVNESALASVLRKSNSCNKGASKACTSACKSVLKGVCHEYKCSSGLKSRFKSECSRNCRTRFDVN